MLFFFSYDFNREVFLLGVVVSGGLGQIGVDDNDGDGLIGVVDKDLGQNALAGGEDGLIVVLGQNLVGVEVLKVTPSSKA